MTEESPQKSRTFEAKVTANPDGTVEIMLFHEGRKLVKSVTAGLMPLIQKAEELIANPPTSLNEIVRSSETVVTVLRHDPNSAAALASKGVPSSGR